MNQMAICIMLTPKIKNTLVKRALGNKMYKIHLFVKTHI